MDGLRPLGESDDKPVVQGEGYTTKLEEFFSPKLHPRTSSTEFEKLESSLVGLLGDHVAAAISHSDPQKLAPAMKEAELKVAVGKLREACLARIHSDPDPTITGAKIVEDFKKEKEPRSEMDKVAIVTRLRADASRQSEQARDPLQAQRLPKQVIDKQAREAQYLFKSAEAALKKLNAEREK